MHRRAILAAITLLAAPDEFRAFLEAEVAKWGGILREGNIRLD